MLLGLFGIQPNDGNVHLCTSPNYHTAVTTFAGNALNSGHAVVFMDKWDPEQTLAKIERMLEKHLEFPVDYLPSQAEVMTGE